MVKHSFWEGKRVLITGHTGFKGSWLSLWLHHQGAAVFGYALEPETNPALFNQLGLGKKVQHHVADIRDVKSIALYVRNVTPDVVFHMAAQPLVRRSYQEPSYTWETNVIGTINLLEATKQVKERCAVVIVTTDKVYENKETDHAYVEEDRLGGFDPYSSSKAAAELVVNSWRNSFFKRSNIRIATARAGNVIGGGDWSVDRIIPDAVRALSRNQIITVRNPKAVRPWQHVLEPLSGYMRLAEFLYNSDDTQFQSAFNFGPMADANRTVEELIKEVVNIWPGQWKANAEVNAPHEAGLLTLNIHKATSLLGWRPSWNFEESMKRTINWYQDQLSGKDPIDLTIQQINEYTSR